MATRSTGSPARDSARWSGASFSWSTPRSRILTSSRWSSPDKNEVASPKQATQSTPESQDVAAPAARPPSPGSSGTRCGHTVRRPARPWRAPPPCSAHRGPAVVRIAHRVRTAGAVHRTTHLAGRAIACHTAPGVCLAAAPVTHPLDHALVVHRASDAEHRGSHSVGRARHRHHSQAAECRTRDRARAKTVAVSCRARRPAVSPGRWPCGAENARAGGRAGAGAGVSRPAPSSRARIDCSYSPLRIRSCMSCPATGQRARSLIRATAWGLAPASVAACAAASPASWVPVARPAERRECCARQYAQSSACGCRPPAPSTPCVCGAGPRGRRPTGAFGEQLLSAGQLGVELPYKVQRHRPVAARVLSHRGKCGVEAMEAPLPVAGTGQFGGRRSSANGGCRKRPMAATIPPSSQQPAACGTLRCTTGGSDEQVRGKNLELMGSTSAVSFDLVV
ncbi:hypothetical protein SUDANB176_00196 [Streptomyces sp. enrichment culture]